MGRPRALTPEQEEAILNRFHANPSTSTRAVGLIQNIRHQVVHEVAVDDGLKPYHHQKVHKIKPEDRQHRMNFSGALIERMENDPDFLSRILFTDEATFTRDGIFNFHNNHTWSHANPHSNYVQGNQERFSVNVWTGIIGDHLIGPYIMPARMTGLNYLIFLQDVLPELLEEVPLEIRNAMWYQHDGAPPNFHGAVQQHLHATFPGRWMGRGGSIPWPARSPDKNPLDFFYWGFKKELVYDGTEIEDVEELVARIAVAGGIIRVRAEELFPRVRESLVNRLHLCLRNDAQGGNFEHLL